MDLTIQNKLIFRREWITVYNGIYSIGSSSIASTSRILEVDGNLSRHGRHYVSGNAFGPEIFKANGYIL